LYIPLTARIYVSRRFPEYFYDEKALSLEPYIPGDTIRKNSSEYECMASVARSNVIDCIVKSFLNDHPDSNVVFLGAGLETTYYRIGNKKAHFYEIDLPEVIEARQRVLGIGENEKLIAGDMFKMEWAEKMDTTLPTLLVVSGVYEYFHEDEIVQMIRTMKKLFPNGELAFDTTDSAGLKYTNKYVQRTGNTDAMMYFGLDDPAGFAEKCGTRLLAVSGFFGDALKLGKKLSLKTRVFMYFADKWKRTMVVRMKLNK
jgi:O-methyltransferase involved in polyketide biosynthesis